MCQEASAELEPSIDADRSQRWILIIEDDEAQTAALARRLQQQGFQVMGAGSGREGLSAACKCRPDVIVLDLKLPDMEGFEVCEQLSDAPQTCDVPVIIVSGMDDPDVVRRARRAGCRYYLRKPYDPNALLLLIEDSLSRPLPSQW